MKFAQFLAVGIAMASAAAFAGGDKHRSSQSSEQQNTQAPRDQQAQGQGTQQDQDTVKQAQEQLSSMGHDAGPADGIMGPKTQAAVKEFQQSKGLQASGRLDNQTLAALQTGGNEGAPRGQSSGSQSSNGQSMSNQPSGAPSSSNASPSRDTQPAAPSTSRESKY